MQEIEMIKTNLIVKNENSANAEEAKHNRHTEDIQEIISKVPSWILRWGTMLFFCMLIMIVAISFFVYYPDTVKGELKFESSAVAAPVIVSASGRITTLFIKQGAFVKQGQPLARISTLNDSARKYILSAPLDGKVGFVAIVQQGAFLNSNQQVFIVHPINDQFYGIMKIPAANIDKIRPGEQVLINLRNYPADEYGRLKGTISYVADEPDKDGLFAIKVTLHSNPKSRFVFSNWITGDAEVITENASLESRIYKNIMNGFR